MVEVWLEDAYDDMAQPCRAFGIRRKTGYEWLEGFDSVRQPWSAIDDLERMESYESRVRVACTKALLDQDHHVTVCTLSKATLVRMGVAVANIALGGRIKGAKDRADFDAMLAQAIQADGARPDAGT